MKDYRKEYNKSQTDKVEEELVEELDERIEDNNEAEEENQKQEETQNQPEPVYGVVHNCEKLNVRKQPSKDSEIVFVLNEGSEISIDEENSTEEWYSITHVSGVEGFCMKQFVSMLV